MTQGEGQSKALLSQGGRTLIQTLESPISSHDARMIVEIAGENTRIMPPLFFTGVWGIA